MNDTAKLVTLLFCTSEPVKLKDLSKSIGIDQTKLSSIIDEVNTKLKPLGLCIITSGQSIQLTTLGEYAELIDKFYQATPQLLTQASLEVLSIVAHKQPISRVQIDDIRGVASEQSIRNLLNKNLINQYPSKDSEPKYQTTMEFLKLTGLKSIQELEKHS